MKIIVFTISVWIVYHEIKLLDAANPPKARRLPLTMLNQRRKVTGSASEPRPIMIKIGSPGSRTTGRAAPKLPHPLPESSIVRLEPVIKFHVDNHNNTGAVSDDDVKEFHEKMSEMGLHKMSDMLQKANLTKEILNLGAITLFSPTDEAFALSARGFVESLLSSSDDDSFRNFLLHHVIRGHMLPADVRNDFLMPSIRPSAAPLRFNIYNGGQIVSVSGAQFLDSGSLVGNVQIQPIDRILSPPAESDILQKTRESSPGMDALLRSSDLMEQIGRGTFTLFCPTNEAFSALPVKARQLLLSNSTMLRKLLQNHLVPGTYFSTVLTNGYRLKPLGGPPLVFTTRRGLILVNGVPVVNPDIPVTNGVIHFINRILVSDDLIEQCRCMTKYPLVPATLRPVSQTRDTTSVPLDTEDTPTFGTRLRTRGNNNNGDENGATDDPVTDVSSYGKVNRKPALLNLLGEPMKLPDGRTVTFNTAAPLFRKSLLLSPLHQPGNVGHTVLLPTDDAFQALPQGQLAILQQNPVMLTRVLQWHVLKGTFNPSTLTDGSQLQTLSGSTLPVSIGPRRKAIMIGGIQILASRRALNGAVFAVNRVMYPPPEVIENPFSLHTTTDFPTDELSIWRKLIDDVPDLKMQLKSRNQLYTMFAPTNTAFAALRQDQFQRLLKEDALKRDLIRSHVLNGALYRRMLVEEKVFPTLFGNNVHCSLLPSGFLVNDVEVTRPAIQTSNGVVYVVNKFISFPDSFNNSRSLPDMSGIKSRAGSPFSQTIEDIARQNNATTFLKWIHASGLRGMITVERKCTLFLPTNDAIATMSSTLRAFTLQNLKALRKLVQYHVCDRLISSMDDLNNDDLVLPTLLPKTPIRCNAYRNRTVVTASGCSVQKVVAPKDEVSVVIIDKPLSPPVGDLFLTMSKSPMLRNFTKIVRFAEMESELRSDAPYSVFAPSKCAFAKMAPEEYEQLITDKEAARAFVSRHLVPGCFYTKGLVNGMTLATVGGNQLQITTPPDCIRVNDVKLKFGDLSATNGVLHIVAKML